MRELTFRQLCEEEELQLEAWWPRTVELYQAAWDIRAKYILQRLDDEIDYVLTDDHAQIADTLREIASEIAQEYGHIDSFYLLS